MSATRHADTHRALWRPVRSATDRIVAGVAGGLADQLRVDPVLIRLAFVVLSRPSPRREPAVAPEAAVA